MAKQTREEWLAGLKVGDVISCKFPGDEFPSVGRVELVDVGALGSAGIVGGFPGRPCVERFWDGHLAGHDDVLLWMVATGSGGSVGLPIRVSNLQARADGKDADDAG